MNNLVLERKFDPQKI